MKLGTALITVMFTLKLLGLFPHSWLLVFSPALLYMGLIVVVGVLKGVGLAR